MGTEGEIIFQTYILACYFRTGCARVKENRSSSKIIKKNCDCSTSDDPIKSL